MTSIKPYKPECEDCRKMHSHDSKAGLGGEWFLVCKSHEPEFISTLKKRSEAEMKKARQRINDLYRYVMHLEEQLRKARATKEVRRENEKLQSDNRKLAFVISEYRNTVRWLLDLIPINQWMGGISEDVLKDIEDATYWETRFSKLIEENRKDYPHPSNDWDCRKEDEFLIEEGQL